MEGIDKNRPIFKRRFDALKRQTAESIFYYNGRVTVRWPSVRSTR